MEDLYNYEGTELKRKDVNSVTEINIRGKCLELQIMNEQSLRER